jgi:hypothetical protein
MSATQTFRELTYTMRPQNPTATASGCDSRRANMVGIIPTTCPRTLSIPAVANSLWAAHFALTDRLHRAQGDALEGGARPARMPVPSDLFGAALAFTRIWRARRTTIAAHGACTNQTTVHLGPHSFRKRRALLLASGFPRPSARMDAAKPRRIDRCRLICCVSATRQNNPSDEFQFRLILSHVRE